MKHILTISSLISIVLFVLHLADDIVHGIEPGGLSNLIGGTAIAVVWLYGTLALTGRLAGYLITLLGGLGAFAVPVLHMSGKGVGEIARSDGGFFFVTTLLFLGVTGVFGAALSALALWNLRKTKSGVPKAGPPNS